MSFKVTAELQLRYEKFKANAQDASKTWRQLGNTMTTVGRDLSVAVAAPLALIAKQMYEVGEEFDLTTQKLKGLSGPGAQGLQELSEQARQLGAETIFTASQIVDLQLSLRRLGQTNEEIAQITPTVLKLAQALDTDLAEAGEFVVQTLNRMDNSFNIFFDQSSAAAFAAEGFAFAVSNSALTMDSLRSSLNYVGSEANAAGLTFADTAAILATLADNGYTGSRAGTQLRRVFTELTKDGQDVSKEFFDIVKSGVSFEEALDRVGVRAAGVFSALAGNSEAIRDFSKRLQESQGNLDFFAETMDESLYAASQKVSSAFGELSISMTQALGPAIILIQEAFARILRGFSKFPTVAKVVVAVLGATAIALPPVIFLVGSLTKALAAATFQSAALGLAMRTIVIGGPILAAALAAVALAVGGISTASKEANEELERVKNIINEIAKTGDQKAAVRAMIEERDAAQKRLDVAKSQKTANEEAVENAKETLSLERERLQQQARAEGRYKRASSGPQGFASPLITLYNAEEEALLQTKRSIVEFAEESAKANQKAIDSNTEVVNQLNARLELNKDIVDSLYREDEAQNASVTTIAELVAEYNRLSGEIINVQNNFRTQGGNLTQVQQKLKNYQDLLNEVTNQLTLLGVKVGEDAEKSLGSSSIEALLKRYNEVEARIEEIRNSGGVINLDQLQLQVEKLDELRELLKLVGIDLEQQAKDAEKALEAENKLLEDQYGSWLQYQDVIGGVNDEIAKLGSSDLENELAALDERLRSIVETFNLNETQADALAEKFAILKQNAIDLAVAQKNELFLQDSLDWFQSIIGLSDTFVNSMANVANGTKSFGDALKETLGAVLKRVIALSIAFVALNILAGRGNLAASAVLGTQTFGSFLTSNLLGGLAAPTRSSGGLNVRGVVSGSNLIIANTRGVTAFDRTYG